MRHKLHHLVHTKAGENPTHGLHVNTLSLQKAIFSELNESKGIVFNEVGWHNTTTNKPALLLTDWELYANDMKDLLIVDIRPNVFIKVAEL